MTAASYPSKPQKEEVEIQEGAASLAVAKETSADVAVGAVVSETESIFTLKDRKRTALKAECSPSHLLTPPLSKLFL